MADYRDLLRRAVEALPENNGAARRQVYDKARKALYSQLRAIAPPLPSREITQHRLQLEDCIREVEQRATEQLLSNFDDAEIVAEAPLPAEGTSPLQASVDEKGAIDKASDAEPVDVEAADEPEAVVAGEAMRGSETAHESEDEDRFGGPEEAAPGLAVGIDELAAEGETEQEANSSGDQDTTGPVGDVADERDDADPDDVTGRQSSKVARGETSAEAGEDAATMSPSPLPGSGSPMAGEADATGKGETGSGAAPVGSIDDIIRQAQLADESEKPASDLVPGRGKLNGVGPGEHHSEPVLVNAAAPTIQPGPTAERREPSLASSLSTSTSVAAMSTVREVEVDARAGHAEDSDPQRVIDKAIAALDVEARGESNPDDEDMTEADADGEGDAEPELQSNVEFIDDGGRSGNALTIFLVVFVLLLVGVGGAGYWAWREGYVDLSALLGQGTQVAQTDETGAAISPTPQETTLADAGQGEPGNTVASTPDANPGAPTMGDAGGTAPAPSTAATTPNTTADANTGSAAGSASTGTPAESAGNNATAQNTVPAAQPDNGETKVEDRLSTAEAAPAAPAADNNAGTAPEAGQDGNQALLLEASDSGSSGAVPYSGTVEWTRGTDELGQPTIEAKANIPARNMNVKVLIRKNSDATLPASHLMEIDFDLSDSFIGGGIGRVVGVLMKDKELVQGKPLVGASARVVGNSFLFALTADAKDVATNEQLLQDRKWMDLALIYSTGKRAIITLEKSAAAETLFKDVMSIWGTAAPADAGAAPASGG